MNSKSLKLVYSFMMPGGLLLASAVALTRFPVLPPSASQVFLWLPYAVFAIGALLSWRFNRSRVLLAMVALAIVYAAILFYVFQQSENPGAASTILAAIALLLPMNLALFSAMQEKGIASLTGGLCMALIGMQLVVVALLCRPELSDIAALLQRPFFQWKLLNRLHISQPALIVFILSMAVLVVRFIWRPKPLEGGFFWALVTAFLALNAASQGRAPGLYFTTAGLILVASLIEMSYHLAFLDELTGLPGRRAFNEAALKLSDNYSVAVVDVDHFKKFNDTHGHECGDQVLRMVANCLGEVSGGGQVFRYGGEEFAVIFVSKSAKQCLTHLDDLRQRIADTDFTVRGNDRRKNNLTKRSKAKHGNKKKLQVTVSIGVACHNTRNFSFDQVVRAADKALYRAKDAGRNCVQS
ncbi:MAG TPA: GGDEF domain-containing protein [Candidatus Angelobacter sp.]|jgi:diguanylate cyclase (GGDEF)-like protein|nr:GGDEF domain-containing protein [Candidatus Angelobacter sp.]